MREIVMDTETTGLNSKSGDRIVEIGGVELVNHLPTGKVYHQHINPERDMPQSAFDIHGLSTDFLKDKPIFAQIAQGFLDFIGDAKLVIHNATFDIGFLNMELARIERPQIPIARGIDTLEIAQRRFPGAQNSLDALCRRFGVTTERTLHGALLDSEILSEVYLELIGGRQPDFTLSIVGGTDAEGGPERIDWTTELRPKPLAPRITEAETENHNQFIKALGPKALWLNL